MVHTSTRGIFTHRKAGIQVSRMWSCCPSALKTEVQTRVFSEAGEPESPKAPAAATSMMMAAVLMPML